MPRSPASAEHPFAGPAAPAVTGLFRSLGDENRRLRLVAVLLAIAVLALLVLALLLLAMILR